MNFISERWPIFVGVGCVVLIVLAIIFHDPMVEGSVVDKSYQAPYTSTSWDPNLKINKTTYHPARYLIEIQGYSKEGESKTGWVSVTELEYHECKIDMYWKHGKGCE